MDPATQEIVGLIPAGGQATRLSPLPCSKELFPIGFRVGAEATEARPKVVSHYLLEKMRFGGVSKAYIVLRPGKWDIPAYFGDGSFLNMHLAYLSLGDPFGVPFTLDQAYSFLKRDLVAFGFPDILFESDEGFAQLVASQAATHADVVLGLFPATHPFSREDRVEFGSDNVVRKITLRPTESDVAYSWAIAVWNPAFTHFLHQYVAEHRRTAAQSTELSAGHAIQAAIDAGLNVASIVLGDKPYVDIGTPEGLRKALNCRGAL